MPVTRSNHEKGNHEKRKTHQNHEKHKEDKYPANGKRSSETFVGTRSEHEAAVKKHIAHKPPAQVRPAAAAAHSAAAAHAATAAAAAHAPTPMPPTPTSPTPTTRLAFRPEPGQTRPHAAQHQQ